MRYVEYSDDAIKHLCAADEHLKAVVQQYGRLERPQRENLFEALIGSLVSQQISTKAADAIWARLEEATGIDPLRLAGMEEGQLRALGLSGRKAQYVKGAAKAVTDGTLDLNELESMGDEQVEKTLSALYGVGVWTAQMLMIFSLGRQDVLSIRDLGVVRGISRAYGIQAPGSEFLDDVKRRVSPYGTAASLYFWAVAGDKTWKQQNKTTQE